MNLRRLHALPAMEYPVLGCAADGNARIKSLRARTAAGCGLPTPLLADLTTKRNFYETAQIADHHAALNDVGEFVLLNGLGPKLSVDVSAPRVVLYAPVC
jgi:hypothetical protein